MGQRGVLRGNKASANEDDQDNDQDADDDDKDGADDDLEDYFQAMMPRTALSRAPLFMMTPLMMTVMMTGDIGQRSQF